MKQPDTKNTKLAIKRLARSRIAQLLLALLLLIIAEPAVQAFASYFLSGLRAYQYDLHELTQPVIYLSFFVSKVWLAGKVILVFIGKNKALADGSLYLTDRSAFMRKHKAVVKPLMPSAH